MGGRIQVGQSGLDLEWPRQVNARAKKVIEYFLAGLGFLHNPSKFHTLIDSELLLGHVC